MDDVTQRFVNRINNLIDKIEPLLATKYRSDYSDWVKSEPYTGFYTQAVSTVIDIVGLEHSYTKKINTPHFSVKHTLDNVTSIRGVLTVLKEDLENGYLTTASEIAHAELFSNFSESAKHLLVAGYKDAAAVIIGSVLEEHLRQLSIKNGIKTTFCDSHGNYKPKKASQINEDLCKGSVYLLTKQKQITAWLDLRNNAAHAHYSMYKSHDVDLMIQGIEFFVAQFPA